MPKKKVVLNFPPQLIDQPITYRLVKDFGFVVNILRARNTPQEWGTMVVELDDPEGKLEAALAFLAVQGVGVEPLSKELAWHEERCIQCTACTGPCPTHALAVADRIPRAAAAGMARAARLEAEATREAPTLPGAAARAAAGRQLAAHRAPGRDLRAGGIALLVAVQAPCEAASGAAGPGASGRPAAAVRLRKPFVWRHIGVSLANHSGDEN